MSSDNDQTEPDADTRALNFAAHGKPLANGRFPDQLCANLPDERLHFLAHSNRPSLTEGRIADIIDVAVRSQLSLAPFSSR